MYKDQTAAHLHDLSKRRHVLIARIKWLVQKEASNYRHVVDEFNHIQTTAEKVNDLIREAWGLPRAKREQDEWLGFVNIRLTVEQKAEFAAWSATDEEVYEMLVRCMEGGHKFSLNHNKQTSSFQATLTGTAGTGNNRGRAMSAYAKEWPLAVRVLMYKHFEIAGGDWLSVGSSVSDDWG